MADEAVHIFTDGACSGNPGPGGWGALLRYKGHEKQFSGWTRHTTNNRMELLAAIRALSALKRPCKVIVHTDSQYLKDGITQWIKNWKANNWRTSSKAPVKNSDLWQWLDKLCAVNEVEWQWVKGHSGHPENEIADGLARKAIENGLRGLLEEDEKGLIVQEPDGLFR